MKHEEHEQTYYLQVIKEGEMPQWPEAEEELVVGSQRLDGGFVQYWAYHNSLGKDPKQLPEAEMLAASCPPSKPSILVKQNGEDLLELILIKDAHAFSRTDSSINNLEDNISEILAFANERFNIKVENFMTTEGTSEKVESKLDDLLEEPLRNLAQVDPSTVFRSSSGIGGGNRMENNNTQSGKWLVWAVLLVGIGTVAAAAYFFGKDLVRGLGFESEIKPAPAITLAPTRVPSPTPTIAIDRSAIKIRVLNGTYKTGAASVLADKLKELGWQILSIGNATNSAFTKSEVRAKEDLDAHVVEAVINDLADALSASRSANLKSTDKADLEVIIGKE